MSTPETKQVVEYFVDRVNELSDEKKDLSLWAKCWDIVKKKNVDICLLKASLELEKKLTGEKAIAIYNGKQLYNEQLTEEEFNTLKEGLEWAD